MDNCEHCKKTPRGEELTKNLKTRLSRVIGQLNGISRMLDENRYCGDILVQIAAAKQALKEIGYMLLDDHMKSCVSEDIKNGDVSSLEEALQLSKKLY